MRIQCFSAVFCLCIGALGCDFALSLHSEEYEAKFPVTLQKIILVAIMISDVGICIVMLAYLGNEVNESTAHHISLLRRLRHILLCGTSSIGAAGVAKPETAEMAGSMIET